MRYLHLAALAAAAPAALAQESARPSFSPSSIKGFFVEQFNNGLDRWAPSRATKEERAGEVFSYVGKWAVEEPSVYPGIDGDEGLVLKSKAAHHAISTQFEEALDPAGKTLVVQYEVKLQKGLDCGGAYMKLLTESPDGIQAAEFSDQTPYTIMFGPDRCGSTSKVHFIFRHKNPKTGEIEEKHLKAAPTPKIAKTSSLYTLIVRPDQSYEIKVDGATAKSGSLLEDFSPAVNPPKQIDDPSDKKPADWVDTPRIADPEATKPEDWDEDAPMNIPDPDAVMPDDWLVDEPPTIADPDAEVPEGWNEEEDGDWLAPMIPNPMCEEASGCGPWIRPDVPNPDYKGKWFAPLVENPEYKGPWSPRKIDNPDYFEDLSPANFNKIAGIGYELWSMTEDILFDNIYIGFDEQEAAQFAKETFDVKKPLEVALEEKDKPAPKADSSSSTLAGEPDMQAHPVAWAKFHARLFFDAVVKDPKEAVKSMPMHAAALSSALLAIFGFSAIIVGAILPAAASSDTVKDASAAAKKKTDEVTEDVKDKVEQLKAAAAAGDAKEKAGDLKKRATAGKTAVE